MLDTDWKAQELDTYAFIRGKNEECPRWQFEPQRQG